MPSLSSRPEALIGQRFRLFLMLFPIALYLALCGSYLLRILHADGGHLVYALDDPYIHLALAEQIARGHYGINPGEAASPSSSPLWPLLLVPFARFSWFSRVPLLLNLFAGVALTGLMGYLAASWPVAAANGAGSAWGERLRRLLAVAALVFISNSVCLAFIGMEHTLQVLLAAVAAFAIGRVLAGKAVPLAALVGVALGPAVRLEAVGLSLAVAMALYGRRQVKAAAWLLAASVLPLVVFCSFLHSQGLPFLPTSVLVKGGVASGGVVHRFEGLLGASVTGAFAQRDRLLMTVLFFTLVELAWREWRRGGSRARRWALGGAALAAGLHLLIGQFNWFHRYEVYIVVFSTLIILHMLFEERRMLGGWFALGLLACALPYLDATRTLIAATGDIYLQQYQMHRFSTQFYKGNVAVNDLGLVSFRRLPGQYVLDLAGLGSAEVALQRNKTPAWLDGLVRRHDVGLVMIYPQWFGRLPSDWTPVGTLCLNRPPVVDSGACVVFFATEMSDREEIGREFHAFSATLPRGVVALPPGVPTEERLVPSVAR